MYLNDIALIFATFAGPVFAIQAQKWLERRREAHSRRTTVFKTLMATRAVKLSAAHVEALNMIDIEFTDTKRFLRENRSFKRVRSAWQAYLEHLRSPAPDPTDEPAKAVYFAQRDELFIDLLYEMATALNYGDFDKNYIRRNSYVPNWHQNVEMELTIIRKGLVDFVLGRAALPMKVVEFPNQNQAEPTEATSTGSAGAREIAAGGMN